jgi:REP element-mobilizing transposase RayT
MKPGVYTQMYIQVVFAVRNRQALLTSKMRPRVFRYISGIITDMKHKSIIVNGVSDHIHIFLGLNPSVSLSDTVYEIKRSSSLFINDNRLSRFPFNWQEGYGAFSYSKSHIDRVYKYILNQQQHHDKISFRAEYLEFLKRYEVEYDERYLFEFFE